VESSEIPEMRDQDAGFGKGDPEAGSRERLEAAIEQADHALGSESFGTTAEGRDRGEVARSATRQELTK